MDATKYTPTECQLNRWASYNKQYWWRTPLNGIVFYFRTPTPYYVPAFGGYYALEISRFYPLNGKQ